MRRYTIRIRPVPPIGGWVGNGSFGRPTWTSWRVAALRVVGRRARGRRLGPGPDDRSRDQLDVLTERFGRFHAGRHLAPPSTRPDDRGASSGPLPLDEQARLAVLSASSAPSSTSGARRSSRVTRPHRRHRGEIPVCCSGRLETDPLRRLESDPPEACPSYSFRVRVGGADRGTAGEGVAGLGDGSLPPARRRMR